MPLLCVQCKKPKKKEAQFIFVGASLCEEHYYYRLCDYKKCPPEHKHLEIKFEK